MSARTEVGLRRHNGLWRHSRFGSGAANTLAAAKRNPVAAMLIIAGAGCLIGVLSEKTIRNSWPRRPLRRSSGGADRIPVLNTGQARLYDPDAPLRPMQDLLESRREMSARV